LVRSRQSFLCRVIVMSIRRKKSNWAMRVTAGAVIIGLLVLYVASFGPACWVATNLDSDSGRRLVAKIYHPIFLAVWKGPVPVSQALYWYANAGIPDSRVVLVPVDDEDGSAGMSLLIPRE